MRAAGFFAIVFSVWSRCLSQPLVELPREAVMDVNKPPFPIVNVISERAPPASSANTASGGSRAETSARATTSSGARRYEEGAFAREVAEQHARLERLRSLRASLQ